MGLVVDDLDAALLVVVERAELGRESGQPDHSLRREVACATTPRSRINVHQGDGRGNRERPPQPSGGGGGSERGAPGASWATVPTVMAVAWAITSWMSGALGSTQRRSVTPAWARAMTRSWQCSRVPNTPTLVGGPRSAKAGSASQRAAASATVRPIETGSRTPTPRLPGAPPGRPSASRRARARPAAPPAGPWPPPGPAREGRPGGPGGSEVAPRSNGGRQTLVRVLTGRYRPPRSRRSRRGRTSAPPRPGAHPVPGRRARPRTEP